jgi:putative oxidoreductase
MIDLALLILRLTVGLIMAAHGAQKLFGWFGGRGLHQHGQWMESLGLRPGWLWAWANVLAEFGGGVLLALGVLTPVAAATIVGAMLMAIALVHRPAGFWNQSGGYEYNVLLIAAAFALGLAGPGTYALQPEILAGLPHPQLFAFSLLAALMGVALGLLLAERAQVAARQVR